MKIKIICLEDEKNIKFNNISSKFEILGDNSFKKRAKYYNIEKNIVEVYYLMEKEEGINKYNLNSNSDMILVLAKSLNHKNIERIKKITSNYNIIVAVGEVNISNKDIKEEFNKLNNVIIINKLKKENTIDLNLLVIMISNKEMFFNLNKQKNTILIDSDESIGKNSANDLKQGIYTLPLIIALENKPSELVNILEKSDYTEDDVVEIIKLVNKYDGVNKAREIAKKYTNKAYKQIKALPENEYREILLEITKGLLDRIY